MTKDLNTKEAVKLASEMFPFKEYMTAGPTLRQVYFNIGNTVVKHLKRGSKILDFGSGPCDKTAVLQLLGYECYAYDDLADDWHQNPGNKDKIMDFAKQCGINFTLAKSYTIPYEKEYFDMVMLHSVIEHFHDSPRELLNDLVALLKPGGLLFITVPNAVNIRKRLAVLLGKTNYTRFEEYYWYPDPYRGHVREYVKGDLLQLSDFLNLDVLEIKGCDNMLEHRLGTVTKPLYLMLTGVLNGGKDCWLLVAKKREDWKLNKELSTEELLKIFPNRHWQ